MLITILTSPACGQPQDVHEQIEAVANQGLAGDRYATGKGFYTGETQWDAHVTLIAREPFDQLAADHGVHIDPRELRRNLITQGVDLNALIGRRFRIGDEVVLRGRKAWPACNHIVKFTGKPEIFQYVAKQCGIGADVLVGGTIRVGDAIVIDHGPASG